MLHQDEDYRCENCGETYTNIEIEWCRPCQINNYKKDFANWTSGNEKIDEFIQTMQLKIDGYYDIVVEWIPYDHLNDISKEIGKSDFATVYLAIWTNSPLSDYDKYNKKYTRESDKKVTLKCLHNSQNIANEFLNEV